MTDERFKTVSAAYRVLSDPAERARYDAGPIRRRAAAPAASRRRAAARAPRQRPRRVPPQPTVLGWEMTRRRGPLGARRRHRVPRARDRGGRVGARRSRPGAGDQTGRTVTLWLVATKLLVGGCLAVWIGRHRLRNPLR